MSAGPRVVLDTNVVVSAFLWEGKPGRLIALAGEGDLRLFTSRALLDEVSATLAKPKLAKSVIATGLTAAEMIAIYRRLVTVVRVAPLGSPISRDPDDDKVIACALAA